MFQSRGGEGDTHYVRVMVRLCGIDPLFKALGKNIDFWPIFFKVREKNIDFRPPFWRFQGKKVNFWPPFHPDIDFRPPPPPPLSAPIDFRVGGSHAGSLPTTFTEGVPPPPPLLGFQHGALLVFIIIIIISISIIIIIIITITTIIIITCIIIIIALWSRAIVLYFFLHLDTCANISFLSFVNCVFIHGKIIFYFPKYISCTEYDA